jgi:hypothetical protein
VTNQKWKVLHYLQAMLLVSCLEWLWRDREAAAQQEKMLAQQETILAQREIEQLKAKLREVGIDPEISA